MVYFMPVPDYIAWWRRQCGCERHAQDGTRQCSSWDSTSEFQLQVQCRNYYATEPVISAFAIFRRLLTFHIRTHLIIAGLCFCPRSDLLCIGWDIKPLSLTHAGLFWRSVAILTRKLMVLLCAEDGELRRTLQSLACGKARVLTKQPKVWSCGTLYVIWLGLVEMFIFTCASLPVIVNIDDYIAFHVTHYITR